MNERSQKQSRRKSKVEMQHDLEKLLEIMTVIDKKRVGEEEAERKRALEEKI